MCNSFAYLDDNLCDLDCPSLDDEKKEEPDIWNERVYLVPYRWWKEAQGEADRIEGVMFTASTNSDFDSGIVLQLKKGDDHNESETSEVGSSGHQYALIFEEMWLRALERCNDLSNALKDIRSRFHEEDFLPDLFFLQVSISFWFGTNSLVAKISPKGNAANFYQKACDIFSAEYSPIHIWDFTGQTTQINEDFDVPNGFLEQSGKEVHLELQVQGLSDFISGNGREKTISDGSQMERSSRRGFSCRATDSSGMRGLTNLGNTCFMNSAIQCLIHTPKLVDFFMREYEEEINYENPSGTKGELALNFGVLLRWLWVPGTTPVAPRMFKKKLANFAPQFKDSSQHDSQELLAFLLDGLHEDLNRVKRNANHDVKAADGRPDEVVAEEYWQNYLASNDSIIVDLFQGQFRSKLECSVCKKDSIKYDPFMYLSLPVPRTTRAMTLTVLSTDGITSPSAFTVTVPACSTLKNLIESLGAACSLTDDETLLVAEIYGGRIFRLLNNPSESLALINDEDRLVAYRLQTDNEASPLVVFTHKRVEKDCIFSAEIFVERSFGIPVVARLPCLSCGYDIRREYLKLIRPCLRCNVDILDTLVSVVSEDNELGDDVALECDAGGCNGTEDDIHSKVDFEFRLHAREGGENVKIKMNEPLPFTVLPTKLDVAVLWSEKMIREYDTSLLCSLPEVFTKGTQGVDSIYNCLEAFLKEEPLGAENMWYCPSCEKSQQATKKLDLWRLPEILIVHLKRFSCSLYSWNKLETFVDFPIDDLDISTYVANKNSQSSSHYVLYAVTCHNGSLREGHYTAFVRHGDNRWYEFDDSSVELVIEDMIKTSAAYVLFYRRV